MRILKKSNVITGLLIVLIILSIALIIYYKAQITADDSLLRCIAEKSHLYVSKTCSHCTEQKIILGDGLKYFNMTDCIDEPDKCNAAGITGVPDWQIGGKLYPGVRTIEELKTLTGC